MITLDASGTQKGEEEEEKKGHMKWKLFKRRIVSDYIGFVYARLFAISQASFSDHHVFMLFLDHQEE